MKTKSTVFIWDISDWVDMFKIVSLDLAVKTFFLHNETFAHLLFQANLNLLLYM